MADDRQLSQLISKSLRHELSGEEREQVRQHLEQNEESRKFARLSLIIQDSIVQRAERCLSSDDRESFCLSMDVKQRMKDSVKAAAHRQLQESRTAPSAAQAATADPAGSEREVSSRFQLLRLLGKGGLGNVWLARDLRLNRTLAIKELHRDSLESEQAWQRFQREAEITGHLEHPNVVPVYQFGEDRRTGEPFYVMRFVGKRTLADAIVEHHDRVAAGEDCGMGLHRLLSVFLDVCQAIAYAHSRGVIHRDLKPENVALDNFGQVIVLDWGLAKVLEDGELANKMTSVASLRDSSLHHTVEGDVVGTPLYMAPEQAAGQLDEIDQRTDVYGLGAILFAILTGQAPHENSVDRSAAELSSVLQSIADGETPRPGRIRRNLPRDLEAICLKAMSRKRHLRFDRVQDLSEAVERWMAGQSDKQASYDNLRMEGRELRADLQSAVRDLERNVRFMSGLPPIQELIHASTEEEHALWRERLASIFHGLLRANPDYRNVVYSQVSEDEFTELVRVERHSQDDTNIRVVPRSRLRTQSASTHFRSLVTKKPGEVLTSLVCDPLCDKEISCPDDVGLCVGVPVYDEKTEDVFGVVMIVGDMNQLLRRQLGRRISAAEVVVACDTMNVMMHARNGQIVDENRARPLAEVATEFVPAIEALQNGAEYIDEVNADIYGARLWFIPQEHGLMYLLRRKSG
jgi:serine/threonine protein kinase